jgi:adenosylcobalamin-dependent ribonucleoside-triphosphate reductase
MSARALAVYQRTYSRPLLKDGHETFDQTVDRVIRHQQWLWARAIGHTDLSEMPTEQFATELEALRALMLARKVLPSGRTMWLGGTEIARTRELSQFACSGSLVKTVYDVVDQAWLLLNGCGIGVKPEMGVLNGFARPIKDIQVIRTERTVEDGPSGEDYNTETWNVGTKTWTIRIGDSGEAWAKAVGKLVAGKQPAKRLVLDFRPVRAEGSLLSRYGWRSSGDTVISQELPKVAAILSRRAGQLLTRLDILDIINHLGVIQTGRRGAEIGLMDEGDPEIEDFIRFKKDCWADPARSQRQQSNNSIIFWRKPTRRRLEDIFSAILASGGNEPGFINGEAARRRAPWFATCNPCVEIILGDKSFCNLFEVDVAKFYDLGELCEALRLAGRANYRQTAVNLDDGILQRSWHELNEYLRLCGVSITGVARRPDLSAHDLRTMRTAATLGAWSMADELGMPRPKNVTCVKPSGTLGKVMDTTEGAHKPLGRYVFNSIVYGRTDPLVAVLRDAGYEVRPHPTAETQVLVKFPVESAGVQFEDMDGTPVNLEPAVEQLERYRLIMENWCDQNCSLTVSYDPAEVPAIIDWMMAHWDSYVGVSWAFRTDPTKTAADFGAAYLPQAVVGRETFEEYVAGLKPLDVSARDIGGALELDELEAECEGGVCPVR